MDPEQAARTDEIWFNNWGTPVPINFFVPSLQDDDHFRDWWARSLRLGASPGAALALLQMNRLIDVRDLVVGSGLKFDDQGLYKLKGFPDAWQLYRINK